MDDADRAQNAIERELDAALASRPKPKFTYRLHCEACWVLLEQHRREYGICVECASDRERRTATR